jgi:pimeloyl-ACP methyl ester carboxylesterase
MEMMSEFLTIQGMKIEVERMGSGSPLLVLLSEEAAFERTSPFIAELSRTHELVIPQAPGFGNSERPDWIGNPDDISYIYLDMVEKLGLKNIPVLGLSFGGWIAAEMAVKDDSFISKLVLVSPFGVKIGGPFDRDIQDIWTLHPSKVAELKYYDTDFGKRDYTQTPEEEVTIVARNLESFARFCWDPYMHNPKLRQRLHRVNVPTLLIWGDKDSITSPAYGEAYAKLIPGAKFSLVPGAGHYPHIEKPDAFLSVLKPFIL